MTAPVSDLGFSYEFGIDLDVNYGTELEGSGPDWRQLAYITNAGPTNSKNMSDAATYRDRGASRNVITGEEWELAFDHQVQRNDDGTYVAVLQHLVDKSKFGRRNARAKAHVRFYDTEGADWAFEGYAYVGMERANRGNADIGMMSFTLTGDGAPTEIANPYEEGGVGTFPVIATILPTGQGTGDLVVIEGTGFGSVLANLGVSVDGNALPGSAYTVDNNNHITLTLPSGSAGTVPVTVTNAAGESAPVNYTRA